MLLTGFTSFGVLLIFPLSITVLFFCTVFDTIMIELLLNFLPEHRAMAASVNLNSSFHYHHSYFLVQI